MSTTTRPTNPAARAAIREQKLLAWEGEADVEIVPLGGAQAIVGWMTHVTEHGCMVRMLGGSGQWLEIAAIGVVGLRECEQ